MRASAALLLAIALALTACGGDQVRTVTRTVPAPAPRGDGAEGDARDGDRRREPLSAREADVRGQIEDGIEGQIEREVEGARDARAACAATSATRLTCRVQVTVRGVVRRSTWFARLDPATGRFRAAPR